ncbi:hypothetical protein FNV43_RR11175 [Rhamnella rubrinervis]|uniref:J domain-containing protein n=1 Tax=Rhamnella rubrinervis TaxID=2594499 RepID=A0A8K0H530_9ROSA|nr:hypothetical protein FNV43_RR11175 [Rhamnella rubrinervis]
MMWDEWDDDNVSDTEQSDQHSNLNFDLFPPLSKPKDYYKILEVDYDATDDAIRSNYIRLALKWHPDKQKDEDSATSRFQEINEAYQVLSDPLKRREYDKKGMQYVYDYNLIEYLNRYKGLILTCNGLGIRHSIWPLILISLRESSRTERRAKNPELSLTLIKCNFLKLVVTVALIDGLPFLICPVVLSSGVDSTL